jgi:benzodiazapine receptor
MDHALRPDGDRRLAGVAHPQDRPGRRLGLLFFAIQLLLNALWPPVFFSFHQILPALAIILCLWVAILFAALYFWRVERFAAGLMIPYLLWITFATALNIAICRLN